MRRLLHDYNLGVVLLALFAVSWAAQTWFGWREFAAEQAGHRQTAVVFDADGYVWNWARATFENWQSEFIQLFAMVTLTSFLIFRGSPESKDGDEEMRATLERIERRLKELDAASPAANAERAIRPVPLPRTGTTGD